MNRQRRRYCISVSGITHERMRALAKEQGVCISHLVTALADRLEPKVVMITAGTITDEQINRIRDLGLATGDRRLVQECNLALNLPAGFDRDQWRARCAEILNAQDAPESGTLAQAVDSAPAQG